MNFKNTARNLLWAFVMRLLILIQLTSILGFFIIFFIIFFVIFSGQSEPPEPDALRIGITSFICLGLYLGSKKLLWHWFQLPDPARLSHEQ